MEVTFGIPKQREVRREKYPNRAVLTIGEQPVDGGHYKFSFNPTAIYLLGLQLTGEETVTFGFNQGDLFIKVSTTDENIPESDKLRVTKAGTFSSRKLFEYLYKTYDVKFEDEFEMKLAFGNVAQLFKITAAGELTKAIEEPVNEMEISEEEENPFIAPKPAPVSLEF